MKKALVLGGNRFFGKKLVRNLLNEGIEVTLATRGNVDDGFGNEVNRIVIDRSIRETLLPLAEQHWDILFDQSCYSPQEALDVCEVLEGKISRLIFTSSAAVYDGGIKLKEKEYDPYHYAIEDIHPREYYKGVLGYQEAKRVAEAVYFQKGSFPVVAVRLPFVVGEDDYSERLKFHVDKVKSGEGMYIPNRNNVLDFITSDDAGKFLFWLMAQDYVGPINGGAKDRITFLEMIHMIENEVGKAAVFSNNEKDISPYVLFTAFDLNVDLALELGFPFPNCADILTPLIKYYC